MSQWHDDDQVERSSRCRTWIVWETFGVHVVELGQVAAALALLTTGHGALVRVPVEHQRAQHQVKSKLSTSERRTEVVLRLMNGVKRLQKSARVLRRRSGCGLT